MLLAVASCARAQSVSAVVTTPDLSRALTPAPAATFASQLADGPTIAVDDRQRFQTMDGFGAAMTDSSAWLLEEQLSQTQRNAAMRQLFDPKQGIGVSFVRVPIGASDLARNHYSYDEMPAGERDPELKHFSIEHDRAYILPAMREALKLNPRTRVMLSPWSPPGWMKTKDSMIGGMLREDAGAEFAEYLARTVTAYEKAGVPVQYLSLQNEPLYETKDYPGTLLPAARETRLIAEHVGPALAKIGHGQAILAYDHNWDHPEYPLEVLADPAAARFTAGSAFHCYGGEVEAQGKVHAQFPDKGIWMTECSGGTWQKGNLLAVTGKLLIESSRQWAKAVVLWGLVLDEKNGPNAGGCNTCRGFLTVDRSKSPAQVTPTVDYYAVGHASRYVRPGAVRIGSTEPVGGALESVAFENPDRTIALLVLNNAEAEKNFAVSWRGRSFAVSLPAGSMATYVWKADGGKR